MTRAVLILGTIAVVTWATWGPTIGRTIRGHRKGARP